MFTYRIQRAVPEQEQEAKTHQATWRLGGLGDGVVWAEIRPQDDSWHLSDPHCVLLEAVLSALDVLTHLIFTAAL